MHLQERVECLCAIVRLYAVLCAQYVVVAWDTLVAFCGVVS
jgi:hypothetical protein